MSNPKPPPVRDPSRIPKDPARRLEENLAFLGLTRLAQVYGDVLAQASRENFSPLQLLDAAIAEEAAARFERGVLRRVRRARFPVPKTLDAFQWNHPSKIDRSRVLSLFDMKFVEQRRNALFIGGTGLGKSHLAVALGMAACQKGYSVLFTTAMDMVNQLQAAQSDKTLVKRLRQYARPQVLVVDELGYLPVDKQGADLVFQVVSQRYERGSIVLTTNRSPKDWAKIFNDATVASAVLDRLAHHSEIIVIEGKSFRTRSGSTAE
jgi:DNA replication protein DnaC